MTNSGQLLLSDPDQKMFGGNGMKVLSVRTGKEEFNHESHESHEKNTAKNLSNTKDEEFVFPCSGFYFFVYFVLFVVNFCVFELKLIHGEGNWNSP